MVPKFVLSIFAHQRSLTSVIYAHKKLFPFSNVNQFKLLFCCGDRIDIVHMSKECHFQAPWHTESRFKDWLQSQAVTTTAYCKLSRKIIDIKKMGVSTLDLHTYGKKHKNIVATLVSATPINTHFGGITLVLVSVYLRWILCVRRCWMTEFPVWPFQRNVDPWEKRKCSNQYCSAFFSNFHRCS